MIYYDLDVDEKTSEELAEEILAASTSGGGCEPVIAEQKSK